jgi:hypothetical protein
MKKAFLLLCVAFAAVAAGPAAFDPARIAGRYSHHFLNGLVDGSHYWSDDVLEIVPLDPQRAYFRAELQFYNGHSCSIFGVAHAEAGGLVYREPQANMDGGHCVLHIRETATGVRLEDDQSCHDHCGARGTLNGDDFDRKGRRPITYMDRLKRSSEYRDALAEDRGEKTK